MLLPCLRGLWTEPTTGSQALLALRSRAGTRQKGPSASQPCPSSQGDGDEVELKEDNLFLSIASYKTPVEDGLGRSKLDDAVSC